MSFKFSPESGEKIKIVIKDLLQDIELLIQKSEELKSKLSINRNFENDILHEDNL